MAGLFRGLIDLVILSGGALVLAVAGTIWATVRLGRRVRRWRLPRRGDAPGIAQARHWFLSQPWTSAWWWRLQLSRRNMWQQVAFAERSVREAVRRGAPVGELPLLCRELRATATRTESLLLVEGGLAAGREVRQVLIAARQIRSSAAEALTGFCGPNAAELAERCRQEADALSVGLSRSRLVADRSPERPL